ncbi:MAG: DUF2299 family protein [Candidatus Thorarchaeota archaeon]
MTIKSDQEETVKPDQESILKALIRKYLKEDCFIESEPNVDNYEFQFRVKFPILQDKEGNQIGRNVGISKPDKKNYLEINNRIVLPEDALKLVKELDISKKQILTNELKFYLLSQNLLSTIDFDNNFFVFLDKLYFNDSDYPNINELYHSIMKIINSQIAVMNILSGYLGVINKDNIDLETKDSYFQ